LATAGARALRRLSIVLREKARRRAFEKLDTKETNGNEPARGATIPLTSEWMIPSASIMTFRYSRVAAHPATR
jgi:hypothetical protein